MHSTIGHEIGRIGVVVIDDSADVRLLVRTHLELDRRFVVLGEADTARKGLALIRALKPDVAIIDLHLEGRSGLWVLDRLASAGARTVPVILTADATDEASDAALSRGAWALLDKTTLATGFVDDLAECAIAINAFEQQVFEQQGALIPT